MAASIRDRDEVYFTNAGSDTWSSYKQDDTRSRITLSSESSRYLIDRSPYSVIGSTKVTRNSNKWSSVWKGSVTILLLLIFGALLWLGTKFMTKDQLENQGTRDETRMNERLKTDRDYIDHFQDLEDESNDRTQNRSKKEQLLKDIYGIKEGLLDLNLKIEAVSLDVENRTQQLKSESELDQLTNQNNSAAISVLQKDLESLNDRLNRIGEVIDIKMELLSTNMSAIIKDLQTASNQRLEELQLRLQSQAMDIGEVKNIFENFSRHENDGFVARDCDEYIDRDGGVSMIASVRYINPTGNGQSVKTFCTEDGWTVIQSRGQYSFPKDYFSTRVWREYKTGFGEPGEEFWLGLENIYQLTQRKNYRLRVKMQNFYDFEKFAYYNVFSLLENTTYTLQIGGYSGNAGDSLTSKNGMKFSTIDRDNDVYGAGSCAQMYKGAWWYSACHSSNLNGYNFGPIDTPYAQGIVWQPLTGYKRSLAKVEMAIKV